MLIQNDSAKNLKHIQSGNSVESAKNTLGADTPKCASLVDPSLLLNETSKPIYTTITEQERNNIISKVAQ